MSESTGGESQRFGLKYQNTKQTKDSPKLMAEIEELQAKWEGAKANLSQKEKDH